MEFYQRLREELDALKAASAYRSLREIDQSDHGRALLRGNPVWNLSGNDYLGIAGDEAWIRDFQARNRYTAMSSASSRLLTGNHRAYRELEDNLGRFYGGRAALVFNSGYHANIGILPALAGKGDLILSDKLNHASMIDGLRLGQAEFKRYRHLDYEQLGNMLAEAQGKYRQLFIATESVFSMDGDLADLPRLAALKREFHAVLVVDEAHSVGCFGPGGAGLAARDGVLDDVDVMVGTLGKAFGSAGAYAITNEVLREYLVNTMRPFIFTTGMSPAAVAWTDYVLQHMPELDNRRADLARLGNRLRGVIRKHGFATLGESQIVPLIVGDNRKAGELAETFQNAGILVFPIRPPTVPAGTARLRFSLSARLPDSVIDRIDEVLA